jgi:hypothetical protein
VTIFITSVGFSDLEKEIDRVSHMPDRRMVMALDAVLEMGHLEAVGAVHVITGSLKSSIDSSSETEEGRWEGDLQAGGPSTGVNNPVDYAIYEQRRAGHDFFAGLPGLHPWYVAAIVKGLSG